MRIPTISDTRVICKMPDLEKLNGSKPERQHIVDHGVIQRPDGKWQLWACLRGVKVGRLIYGWVGNDLDSIWKNDGIKMRADASWGEIVREDGEESLGAPFFLNHNDKHYCFYHSGGIRKLVSENGIDFKRIENPKISKPASLTNLASIPGGRDIMIMEHDDLFYSYATETTSDRKRSYVMSSISSDLENWHDEIIVSEGGKGGGGPVDAESPFVLNIDGYFYFFRTSSMTFRTCVYCSKDPRSFGINDDSKLLTELNIKIPEFFKHNGQHYMTHISEDFQSVLLSKVNWT
ncbi:MAG: hypothetical protein PF692_14415 [Kiritimatiellae bacterium]|jgi:hypothetical protein|nr:hypothetical protein [Kiritimatiellia bacterium]